MRAARMPGSMAASSTSLCVVLATSSAATTAPSLTTAALAVSVDDSIPRMITSEHQVRDVVAQREHGDQRDHGQPDHLDPIARALRQRLAEPGLEREHDEVAAVEHRDRQQVDQREVDADQREHQPEAVPALVARS